MKKIVLIITVLFLTVFANMAEAQEVKPIKKTSEGAYLVEKERFLEDIGISAIGKAQYCTNFFQEAIDNPGDSILVINIERVLKLKPILKKSLKIERSFIVYDDVDKTISFIEAPPYEEEQSSRSILFLIFSIILMLVSNFFYYKKKDTLTFIFALLNFLFLIVFIFALLLHVISILNFFFFFTIMTLICAFIVSTLTVMYLLKNDNKLYVATSIIFYIFITAHITLLFI